MSLVVFSPSAQESIKEGSNKALGLLPMEQRVLLIKRGKPPSQDLWSLPGGRMEFGETIMDCGKRELLEETGIDPVKCQMQFASRPFTVAEFKSNEHHYIIVELFAILPRKYAAEIKAGDDASGIVWCPVSLFEHRYRIAPEGTDHANHVYPFYEKDHLKFVPFIEELKHEKYIGSIVPVILQANRMYQFQMFELHEAS